MLRITWHESSDTYKVVLCLTKKHIVKKSMENWRYNSTNFNGGSRWKVCSQPYRRQKAHDIYWPSTVGGVVGLECWEKKKPSLSWIETRFFGRPVRTLFTTLTELLLLHTTKIRIKITSYIRSTIWTLPPNKSQQVRIVCASLNHDSVNHTFQTSTSFNTKLGWLI